jgi:hypothetical protein
MRVKQKVKQNFKANHAQKVKQMPKNGRQKGVNIMRSKINIIGDFDPGGSVWESNPPKTSEKPPDGFEVREAHRDSSAPQKHSIHIRFTERNSMVPRVFRSS